MLTVIETLSQISQKSLTIQICNKRPGDLGWVVCDAKKAELELNWKAKIGINEMCRDLINWQA